MRGEWEAGKTLIKNLVLKQLAAQGAAPMKVVSFNPWQWETNDAITKAFFREIARGPIWRSDGILSASFALSKTVQLVQNPR